MTNDPHMPLDDELDPIAAHEARQLLEAAIVERLGDEWDDELEGWTVISRHDYMARLTNGSHTIDFFVDLVGDVTIEEKSGNPAQDGGRMLALAVLGASMLVAIIMARIAGLL